MVDITLVPSSVVIRETTMCSQRYSIAGAKWFVGWKGGGSSQSRLDLRS